jgi:hypothetical protein
MAVGARLPAAAMSPLMEELTMRIRSGGLRAVVLAVLVAALSLVSAVPASADLQPGPWPRSSPKFDRPVALQPADLQPGPWPK